MATKVLLVGTEATTPSTTASPSKIISAAQKTNDEIYSRGPHVRSNGCYDVRWCVCAGDFCSAGEHN
ncbi:hypothetical protein ADUPG1_001225, partial [Aduncisulcus paluster]